jgi:hypothetical protein
MNDKWNDNLEIGGDLQDEYKAIQEAEANEGAPEIELSDDDLAALSLASRAVKLLLK